MNRASCNLDNNRPGTQRRSRRLRKKLHIGEFRELGFELALHLVPNLSAAADDAFWHAFIVECIEARGLSYGGASTGMVVRAGRGSVSVEDREVVRAWLAARSELLSSELGALEDVWYPATTSTKEVAPP